MQDIWVLSSNEARVSPGLLGSAKPGLVHKDTIRRALGPELRRKWLSAKRVKLIKKDALAREKFAQFFLAQ
jgi:hypothetical protein